MCSPKRRIISRSVEAVYYRASQAFATLSPLILQAIPIQMLDDKDITRTQFLVLVTAHLFPGSNMAFLSEHSHVRMPTMTRLVDRLVEKGILTRSRSEKDRRHAVVSATPKGIATIDRFHSEVGKRWLRVLRELPARDVQIYHRSISRLTRQIFSNRAS
jgi:DNA-binding MarR family transcriptional regulator